MSQQHPTDVDLFVPSTTLLGRVPPPQFHSHGRRRRVARPPQPCPECGHADAQLASLTICHTTRLTKANYVCPDCRRSWQETDPW